MNTMVKWWRYIEQMLCKCIKPRRSSKFAIIGYFEEPQSGYDFPLQVRLKIDPFSYHFKPRKFQKRSDLIQK